MTSYQNQRDATIILTDSSQWIRWYRQVRLQSQARGIWEIVDPESNTQPREKPTEPIRPLVSEYEPATPTRNTAPSTSSRTARRNARASTQDSIAVVNTATQAPVTATRYSDLSAEGKEAYDGDTRDYKLAFDSYRIRERKHQEECTNIATMINYMGTTVSPYLQVSCLVEHANLRTWITNLQSAVGVDIDEEIRRTRERYHESLKPMRSPQNWESWLNEYNQAATQAEALSIGDVIQSKLVVDDFLKAVSRTAPAWMATFTGAGSGRHNMERRRMMKLFREHMSLSHPTRYRPKGAFMTGEAAYATNGEYDPNAQEEASSEQTITTSNNTRQGNQKQNKRRAPAQGSRSKQFQQRNTAEAADICLACEQRHDVSNCYYINPSLETPEWFKPNKNVTKLVQYKLQHDSDLRRISQEMNQGSKRPRLNTASRSATPRVKTSQTPDATDR